jgi:predicted trehalose synthase
MEISITYKEKLHKGDYTKIAKMLGGKYARYTVEAQLKGLRTLKKDVQDAADKYIETLDALYQYNADKLTLDTLYHYSKEQ